MPLKIIDEITSHQSAPTAPSKYKKSRLISKAIDFDFTGGKNLDEEDPHPYVPVRQPTFIIRKIEGDDSTSEKYVPVSEDTNSRAEDTPVDYNTFRHGSEDAKSQSDHNRETHITEVKDW